MVWCGCVVAGHSQEHEPTLIADLLLGDEDVPSEMYRAVWHAVCGMRLHTDQMKAKEEEEEEEEAEAAGEDQPKPKQRSGAAGAGAGAGSLRSLELADVKRAFNAFVDWAGAIP